MKKITALFVLFAIILSRLFSCSKSTPLDDPKPDPKPDVKPEEPKDSKHPFLIVTKEMYPALRAKASEEPWKSMKADAITRSSQIVKTDAYKLQEYIGAAALAYILDEPNAKVHAGRVRNAIKNQYAQLNLKETSVWGDVVPGMGSFFSAILALDIVYDALTETEVADCENVIASKISKINRKGSWEDVRLGTHGTWDIYKGDRSKPDNAYYDGIMKQITPNGVSPVTNHYAWERVGGGDSRVSKSGYMDVLEFTGIDKRYYNNERIQKFQRWLFGSSINCAKEMAIFGDMLPDQTVGNYMLHRRVVNFDSEAAAYAAWFHEGTPAIGHILTYVVPKSALPAPKVPSSMLYENGGAFLRDKEDDSKGLQMVLYNIKSQEEWHTHNEVNGLSLSGLGNRLLVNGGRLGEPVRAAFLNNTLTIDGKNHSSRVGGGIVEGFTSDMLDFAIGSAGPALKSATHMRNSILMHSTTNIPGYFIIFDEVESKSGDKVHNYLNPANESSVDVVASLTEYTAKIDHYPTVGNVSASFYYLTPPKAVNIKKVVSAVPDRYPNYPQHNRLEAIYDVESDGRKNLTTLIYPFLDRASLSKAKFERIENENMHACAVSHGNGNTTDYIFETTSNKEISSEGINVKADFCLVRKTGVEMTFYFVKNGTSFNSGKLGFQSDKNVTVYANGLKGKIISEGSKVKLTGVGMNNVKFTPSAEVISSGTDFIEVKLGKGTYGFE